jgi:hypothetical protein
MKTKEVQTYKELMGDGRAFPLALQAMVDHTGTFQHK